MKRVVLCGICLLFISLGAGADETAQQARAILAEHGKKVVVVQLVIKETSNYGGGGSDEYEYTQETFGTVISEDGLIVCSLLATDPALMMEQMGAMGEGEMQSESKVTSVKILFDDNLEKEAQIVLRDKDLDLAFIRLKTKPELPLPFIDLNTAGKAEIFDEVLFVTRLGKVAKRMPSALFSRVLGIVEKPRLAYFVGGFTGDGEVAFTMDGKLLGILLTRMLASGGEAYAEPEMTGVVVPAASVLEVAAQVPSIENAVAEAENEKASPAEPGAKPANE